MTQEGESERVLTDLTSQKTMADLRSDPPPSPPHQYGIKGLQTTFLILMGNEFGRSLNTRYSVGSALPSFRAGPDFGLIFFCRLGPSQTSFFQVEPGLDFFHPEDHPVFVKISRSE